MVAGVAVLRLVLDLTRTLSKGLMGQDLHGTNADDLLLLAAVFIGQAEGRPMTAAKLAQYAGLTRPTAIRKLQGFQARGVVLALDRGRYTLGPGTIDTPGAAQALETAARRVTAAAGELGR